jgi:hypothetical protein
MCPQNKKRGRVAHLSNPATSGAQNPGKPSAHEGGETGVEGAEPPPRGFGGCAPKNIKIRGELPPLANPPRVGPKTSANPQPPGVGKGGSRGAKPPWQGVWGMCPQNKKRGRVAHISNPPRVGPKTLANPQPTGVGKGGGSRGAEPPWR